MISVIIPFSEEQTYLVRCLNAIKRQTYNDVQIILIAEECPSTIINKYNVVFIKSNASNAIESIKDALMKVKGDFFSFCKIDSVIAPKMLESLLCANSEKNDTLHYVESRVEENGVYKIVNESSVSIWGKLYRTTNLIEKLIMNWKDSQIADLLFMSEYLADYNELHSIDGMLIYDNKKVSDIEKKEVEELSRQEWIVLLENINRLSKNIGREFAREIILRSEKSNWVTAQMLFDVADLCHDHYEFNYLLANSYIKATWKKAYSENDQEAYDFVKNYLKLFEDDKELHRVFLQICDLSDKQYQIIEKYDLEDALFFINLEDNGNYGKFAFLERKVEALMALANVIEKELGVSIVGSLTQEHQIINGIKNGLAKIGNGWYYFEDGEINRSYKGLAQNVYGWFYVERGSVDLTYNGIASNAFGRWYVANGKLDKNINGYRKIGLDEAYFSGGKVDVSVNGLIKTSDGWKLFSKGVVDKEFVGMVPNEFGVWYIENGSINFLYEGLTEYQDGWVYISKGTINKEFQGFARNKYGWWYVEDGTVIENAEVPQSELQEISGEFKCMTGEELAHFSIEKYESGELGLRTISSSLVAWVKHKTKK